MITKSKAAPAAAPASIEAQIERYRTDQRAASAQLDALRAARPAMLLDLSDGADAALEAHDAAIAKAGRAVERAQAFQAKLAGELTEARIAEAERGRAARHAAAVAAGKDAEAWLKTDYPRLADKLRAGVARLVEAKALIAAANEHLPDGAHLIPSPEDFRAIPARPTRRVKKKVTVHRDRHGNVVVDPDFRYSDGSRPAPSTPRIEEQEFVEDGEPANRPTAFEATVILPALKQGDPDFWPPARLPHWAEAA